MSNSDTGNIEDFADAVVPNLPAIVESPLERGIREGFLHCRYDVYNVEVEISATRETNRVVDDWSQLFREKLAMAHKHGGLNTQDFLDELDRRAGEECVSVKFMRRS